MGHDSSFLGEVTVMYRVFAESCGTEPDFDWGLFEATMSHGKDAPTYAIVNAICALRDALLDHKIVRPQTVCWKDGGKLKEKR